MPWALRVGEPPAGVLEIPNDHGQQILWKVLIDVMTPQELLQGVELSFGGKRGGVELHVFIVGEKILVALSLDTGEGPALYAGLMASQPCRRPWSTDLRFLKVSYNASSEPLIGL